MLTINTMLKANAAIRDALINTEVEDIDLGFLHGSKKSDECDRLLAKTDAIRDAIELHLCKVSCHAACIVANALTDALTAEFDAHGFDNKDLFDDLERLHQKAHENYLALDKKFFAKLPPKTQTDTEQSEVVA